MSQHRITIQNGQWATTLTREEVADIRARRKAGERAYDVCFSYGISRGLVALVCQRQEWVYITEGEQV